jgi:hypothetical protein
MIFGSRVEEMMARLFAALPPHSAVRLCLTVKCLNFPEAASLLRRSLMNQREASERQSLSALCGGEAASVD